MAEALAEQAGVSTVASAADIGLIAQKVSLQHLDPSVGNIAKLEYAVEMFKDTPGAVHPDSAITRLLQRGNSTNAADLSTARGAAYELEKAYDLEVSGEKVLAFGSKYTLTTDNKALKIFEVDIETSSKFIECKNWNWARLNPEKKQDLIDKLHKLLPNLQQLANNQGKKFEIHFKYSIPQELKEFIIKNKITLIEG